MHLPERHGQLGARSFARWVLIKRIGKPIFRGIDRPMAAQSRFGSPELFDPALFPWVAELEGAAPKIRAGLNRLLVHRERLPRCADVQPDQGNINPDAGWKTFFFGAFGDASEHNRALCPETARALDRIPGVELALFSIVAPGLPSQATRASRRA